MQVQGRENLLATEFAPPVALYVLTPWEAFAMT